jgi:hypothetical protein
MDGYYKNEPLRTYGVPIRSRDYVDEYDSMSTSDRIADVLAGLQQSAINRRTRDLAFLGDLQDFAKTKTPAQRDNALMGARTLTPLEDEIQTLVDREEGKSFDIDAILAGDAPKPGQERREMARELQMPKMSEEELKEMANETDKADEEAARQARIQAIKDKNAEIIAKVRRERGEPLSLFEALRVTPAGGPPEGGTVSFAGKSLDEDRGTVDPLFQKLVDEGRITFSGKTLDDVLTDLDNSTTNISDEDMANRIIAKKEDPRNIFSQFY